MSELSICRATPVRIIPFDLGAKISSKKETSIKEYMKYKAPVKNSERKKRILKDLIASWTIQDDCEFYVFKNGICVVVFLDEDIEIEDNRLLSLYCNYNRKKNHNDIYSWEHRYSSAIDSTIEELRNIISSDTKYIRPSGTKDFENRGMSYTLSLLLLNAVGSKDYHYSSFPYWFKQNLSVLLNPSLVSAEDSAVFTNNTKIDNDKNRGILSNIIPANDMEEYDPRDHQSIFMSWSTVIAVGELLDEDISDLISLEINLQNRWYYAYCIGKSMPHDLDELSIRKMSIFDLKRTSYELDNVNDNLYLFDDSNLPSRIMIINGGLVKTSGIEQVISANKKKIDHLCEMKMLEDHEVEKKYARRTEILLLVIAVLQLYPIINAIVNDKDPLYALVPIAILILIGVLLLFKKYGRSNS